MEKAFKGFCKVETIPFPEIGADMVCYQHEATGTRVILIENDDVNRLFDLTFLTQAVDNTGLPHIFEHATLGGSEKYPSKALFFNLIYQTYNTFMNAFTSDVMTTYPVSSLSEEQLLALADVYADSCFHPMIMKDESIFREEAWRYRLESEEAPLTIEGTVYSEMKGALNLQRMAEYNCYRTLYPHALCSNISGGDPQAIPSLSWERVREYHDLYYTPSNCIAFLYGKLEHPEKFFDLLDAAFGGAAQGRAERAQDHCELREGLVQESIPFPVEKGSDTKNASSVYYAFACPKTSKADHIPMEMLATLLSASSSPLMQRLQEVLPSGSFGCGWDKTTPVGTMSLYANNVSKEDGALFRKTVDEELGKLAETGFPQDMADALAAAVSLETKLIRESSSVGLSVMQGVAYGFASTGDLHYYTDYVAELGRIAERNARGDYAKLIREHLLKASSAALVTTYPEPGLKEKEEEKLALALEKRKESMTAEEKQAVIQASQAEEEQEDASQYVAAVQAVTVASLPEENRHYDIRDWTDDKGIRHMEALAGVDGVGRNEMYLDVSGLPQEMLHWARLYLDLLFYLDGDTHTRQEIATGASRYLYDFSARISAMESGEDYTPRLRISWTAADADLEAGYDLAAEMLMRLNCRDVEKVRSGVQSVRASMKANIMQQPYSLMFRRMLARTKKKYRYASYLNGLDYYAFLGEAEKLLEHSPDLAAERLEEARRIMMSKQGLILSFAGNGRSIERNRPLAETFAARLAEEKNPRMAYDLPVPAASEALIIDSAVQYNGIVADFDMLGLRYSGELGTVTSLVTDSFLYPLLRDRYGAYGVIHGSAELMGVYLSSYRDPNVAQSFRTYEQLPELLEGLELSQEKLDGYILSQYAGLAMPAGELSGAGAAVSDILEGLDPDRVLTEMRELKALTPERVRAYIPVYRALTEKGARFTAGGAAAIRANAELYHVILDPFAEEAKE